MSEAFRSSDDFDEQAHQLYNEGRYDEALTVLKQGITLYPNAVELHIGKAYAHLAREEFAWSRRSFETALGIDPDHEDGLAGIGETLLKLGDREVRFFEMMVMSGPMYGMFCLPPGSANKQKKVGRGAGGAGGVQAEGGEGAGGGGGGAEAACLGAEGGRLGRAFCRGREGGVEERV